MTIKKKLIIVLLSCATIPMIFMGVMTFVNARKAITTARVAVLATIADLKVKLIEELFDKCREHLVLLQNNPIIKKNVSFLEQSTPINSIPELVA